MVGMEWTGNFVNEVLAGITVMMVAGVGGWLYRKRGLQSSKRSTLNNTIWEAHDANGRIIATIEFVEHGARLSAKSKHFGQQINREFSCVGRRSGTQVLLTWEQKDTGDVNFGSLVFKIDSNFREMNGYSTFVRDGNEVEPQHFKFLLAHR